MTKWLLLVCSLAACTPTQVVLYVDTSLGVPCEVDEIAIDVNGDGTFERTGKLEDGPISVTLVQSGGGDYADVNVIARKNGTDVLSGTASVKFVSGKNQELSMTLGPNCTPNSATPCTFAFNDDTNPERSGTSAPDPVARTFCSAGYTMTTRTVAPGDPLVKNACGIAANSQTVTFGGTCETTLVDPTDPTQGFKPCLSNTDCAAGEQCLLGEVLVPDSMVTAFQATGYKFAGNDIPGMWIGQSGYLVFADKQSRPNKTRTDIGLPSTLDKATTPAPAVMPFWDDLLPKTTTKSACIAYTSDGTLWVTWNACFVNTNCAPTDNLVFSVGLESGTDIVRFGYVAMTSTADTPSAGGFTASVGVRAGVGAACTADLCGVDGQCTDGSGACGYTQAFAEMLQSSPLINTSFVFTPNDPK